MTSSNATRSLPDLPSRLRTWIVVAGYILGGWGTLEVLVLFRFWGSFFPSRSSFGAWDMISLGSMSLTMPAPAILLLGCWGFQHRRAWARAVLLTYAGMWVIGGIGMQVASFHAEFYSRNFPHNSARMMAAILDLLNRWLYDSVYSVLLILCLLRREISEFSDPSRGFEPLFKPGQPM